MKTKIESDSSNMYQCLPYPDDLDMEPLDGMYIYWRLIGEEKDEEYD